LLEQVEIISTASILVTVCGGGAVSAMFLPKGASLFTFFNEDEGRLDWDYFNHLGYIRSHWMTRFRRYDNPREEDFEAFIKLLDHELDIISHL